MRWVIEDGVPVPPKKTGGHKFPSDVSKIMRQMKVDQSVCFGNFPVNTVCGAITSLRRHWGMRFVTRITDEGLRVWRTE